jgi:hypothetical protein
MKKKLRIVLSAVIIAAIVFSIHFILSEGEKREVKNLVITYNSLITKAHIEMQAGLMRKLASDWQLKKIDSYIALNLKNKRLIKGELKDLKFREIKVENDLATVITEERWLWSYVDPYTKKLISEVFDEMYGNTYHLKKSKGHWVVDDLKSSFIGEAKE